MRGAIGLSYAYRFILGRLLHDGTSGDSLEGSDILYEVSGEYNGMEYETPSPSLYRFK